MEIYIISKFLNEFPIFSFSEKIAKFVKTILKTLLPHLTSDFSLVAFFNYIFYYLDLCPFNTKPLLECRSMTQYQKIEKIIGDLESVLQSRGHFFKFSFF